MSKTLKEAFNITNTKRIGLNDYDIFKDKDTLEVLRDNILQEVILDNDINNTHSIIDEYTKKMNLSMEEKDYLYNLIDNEVYGVGPLTEVLNDKAVHKIFVNSPSSVYILTNNGYNEEKSISFINEEHIIKTVKKLALNNNTSIDMDVSFNKFNTLDNNKVFLLLPPLSKSVNVIISKDNDTLSSPMELIRLGTITPYMARFLKSAINAKLNILVCGIKGCGKTTLINSLLSFIPLNTRIVSVGFENKYSLGGNTIFLENNVSNILNDISADYIVYSLNNLQEVLKLSNERNGLITSIDTKLGMNALISNILLNSNNLDKNTVIDAIGAGFDIIIDMAIVDNRVRVVSIKEIDKSKLVEVFKYTNNTFDFNKKATATYNKIKSYGDTSLDDIYKEE